MKFDNTQTALKIQMQKRIIAVFSGVFVALLVFIVEFWEFLNGITGLPKWALIILFLLFFILFYIYHLVAASAFISFSDEEGKIVLRFYQLNFFNTNKFSYEIPKNELSGFTLEYKLSKIRENLFLFRRYQGSIVKYPPVPISSLTKSEKAKLINTLNNYISKDLNK
jgi:hypothetical protein